jgi:hypothetical protein
MQLAADSDATYKNKVTADDFAEVRLSIHRIQELPK